MTENEIKHKKGKLVQEGVNQKTQTKANTKIRTKQSIKIKNIKKITKSTFHKASAHVKLVNLNPFFGIQINSRHNHIHH